MKLLLNDTTMQKHLVTSIKKTGAVVELHSLSLSRYKYDTIWQYVVHNRIFTNTQRKTITFNKNGIFYRHQ